MKLSLIGKRRRSSAKGQMATNSELVYRVKRNLETKTLREEQKEAYGEELRNGPQDQRKGDSTFQIPTGTSRAGGI